jgi:hypothetical protein
MFMANLSSIAQVKLHDLILDWLTVCYFSYPSRRKYDWYSSITEVRGSVHPPPGDCLGFQMQGCFFPWPKSVQVSACGKDQDIAMDWAYQPSPKCLSRAAYQPSPKCLSRATTAYYCSLITAHAFFNDLYYGYMLAIIGGFGNWFVSILTWHLHD